MYLDLRLDDFNSPPPSFWKEFKKNFGEILGKLFSKNYGLLGGGRPNIIFLNNRRYRTTS